MSSPSTLPYRPCVGMMVINQAARLFVGERIDTPGAWQMPQGGLDEDEDPEVAALRELEEEIGTANVEMLARTRDWLRYDLPDHLLGKMWGGRYRGQKQLWFLMRFLGDDDEIRLDAHTPEFRHWKWIAPEQLLAEIVPFKRQVYKQVLAEFAPLIRGTDNVV